MIICNNACGGRVAVVLRYACGWFTFSTITPLIMENTPTMIAILIKDFVGGKILFFLFLYIYNIFYLYCGALFPQP